MRAAIVIPSLNSPILDQVLTAVAAQDRIEQVDEVVVVGRDEPGLLGSWSKARLIDTGQPVNPATARNIGTRETAAPLVLYLDSDCIPQAGWLQSHLDAHAAGHAVVGGSVLPDGQNYWSLSYNLGMFHAYLPTAEAGPRPMLPTLNLSVERRVIEEVGLLDERLPRSQDIEWTLRMAEAGFQPWFWPAAAVRHQHNRTTAGSVWTDSARSGRYARQVRLRHRDHLDTPGVLGHPALVRFLGPAIAAGTTARILWQQPAIAGRFTATIPAIYYMKLAWCWGAGERV